MCAIALLDGRRELRALRGDRGTFGGECRLERGRLTLARGDELRRERLLDRGVELRLDVE